MSTLLRPQLPCSQPPVPTMSLPSWRSRSWPESRITSSARRGFYIAKSLMSSADPKGEHIALPIDLIRLSPLPGDKGTIIVCIYQFPGPNYMFKTIDLGPAFFWARKRDDRWVASPNTGFETRNQISLQHFLDFAIGATQCLEMIHHGQGIVHGEIRGDAFHYNVETNKVKLITFGSGLRSFEHGLTSTGWSSFRRNSAPTTNCDTSALNKRGVCRLNLTPGLISIRSVSYSGPSWRNNPFSTEKPLWISSRVSLAAGSPMYPRFGWMRLMSSAG